MADDADGSAGDRRDSCGEIKTRLLTWVTQLGGGEEEAKEKEKKEGKQTASVLLVPNAIWGILKIFLLASAINLPPRKTSLGMFLFQGLCGILWKFFVKENSNSSLKLDGCMWPGLSYPKNYGDFITQFSLDFYLIFVCVCMRKPCWQLQLVYSSSYFHCSLCCFQQSK